MPFKNTCLNTCPCKSGLTFLICANNWSLNVVFEPSAFNIDAPVYQSGGVNTVFDVLHALATLSTLIPPLRTPVPV